MSTPALDIPPFELDGPLPSGVTVLEASAGTGKTYTIAGLAARYVAEGVELEKLLIVTFTRMATSELRDRVRRGLSDAEQGVARFLAAGGPPAAHDRLLRLLVAGDREAVELRRRRLSAALSRFDAATIVTTHGFCQEVLGGLGIAGDLEPGVTFAEDLSDLRDEVVDDLYVRRFHDSEHVELDIAQARQIAREAVGNLAAEIVPADAEGVAGMRARFARAVRAELEARKRRRALMDYDDLLTLLRDALAGPGGEAVAARLRERYGVVLVDEFQDTDPVQWEIMRLAFGEGSGSTLVLIGDPKQAIYAFRGADVYAYLAAARSAGTRRTLDVNWRSDQALIDAYDRLFGGAHLGHEGIVYRPVRATEANQRARLHGAPEPAPLRIRVVHRADPTVGTTGGGYARTDGAREHIAEDLAADVVRLLDADAEVEDPDRGGARVPLAPGHIAVLVRRNRDAEIVRDALDRAGVPAVLTGAGSVFATDAATDWLRLLEALERPSHPTRARGAALTAFLGWSAERIAGAADEDWEDVHRRLHGWAHLLRERGVAALAERVTLLERLPGRLLARADGERRMTDLRHVGELLHAAAAEEQLAGPALTAWLRRRIEAAEQETGDEERSRRLESDAAAVQVLTIHRSKGVEFPVVYLPYLWHPTWLSSEPVPVTFHDPDDGDARKLDVGLEGPDYQRHKRRHLVEQRGEDLRLAYVALTRARHQAVVWWAGTRDSRDSPLGRLVFARAEDGAVADAGRHTPTDDAATERFEALAADAPGCIAVERSRLGPPPSWSRPLEEPAELAAATFDRELDHGWRRTSYSDITALAHEPRVASEPEEDVVDDEEPRAGRAAAAPGPGAAAAGAGGADDDADEQALRAVLSPLGAMPAGVHVGTFVHRVLEAADFAAPDLPAELAACVASVQARRRIEIGDPATVAAGLAAAIETPLGPLAGGIALRDVGRADRLDELDFELPLAGGDVPAGEVTLPAIADVLRSDPALAGYADRLADPALRRAVRGYMTGTIDLVVRLGERFAVVDYKTNWLGVPGEELSAWHHRPAALAAEMARMHYLLQALLYTVALHRYLRWRLAGYDPARHLAGVLYLFVRGMTGPGTPVVGGQPCGVFAWRPAPGLVEALDGVLERGV